ncbi:ABC transporter permease, partial [Actinoplanes philippinensis]|uniref:ABC transporter permease n=1 Tax=Actinoplanes philippinensis TaxID=35752 RepID=UPI0034115393
MLIVTLSSLRARWASLVGTFVALGLGVALIATMGLALASTVDAPPQHPARLAGAAVVVRGADELRVPTRIGDRSQPLANPHAIPPALAAVLAKTGPTVIDRSFPVHAGFPPSGTVGSAPPPSHLSDGAPPRSRAPRADATSAGISGAGGDLVGHPWAVAGLGGHRLVAGREPRERAEIALVADPALLGRTISVRTPSGSGDYTVAGVLAPVTFERAVFFTDDTAASISPRIDNLAVDAAPERVRAIAGGFPGVQVLTGDDRRRADPDPDRDSDALVAMNALLGTAGGITTFVSVFVVASTFAFAVAQRRREMGLLRMAGATPGQIRRSVLAEAA